MCVETSPSVGSSTFATPGPLRGVDPWAEVALFFCSVGIRGLSCEKMPEKDDLIQNCQRIELRLN